MINACNVSNIWFPRTHNFENSKTIWAVTKTSPRLKLNMLLVCLVLIFNVMDFRNMTCWFMMILDYFILREFDASSKVKDSSSTFSYIKVFMFLMLLFFPCFNAYYKKQMTFCKRDLTKKTKRWGLYYLICDSNVEWKHTEV